MRSTMSLFHLKSFCFFAGLSLACATTLPGLCGTAKEKTVQKSNNVVNFGPIKFLQPPDKWVREDDKVEGMSVIRFRSVVANAPRVPPPGRYYGGYDPVIMNIWSPKSASNPADANALHKLLSKQVDLSAPVDLSSEELPSLIKILKHDDQTRFTKAQYFPIDGRTTLWTESEATYKVGNSGSRSETLLINTFWLDSKTPGGVYKIDLVSSSSRENLNKYFPAFLESVKSIKWSN